MTTPAADQSTAEPVALVTVYHANKTNRVFIDGTYKLEPSGSAQVPQEVADRWLSFNYYGAPEVVQRQEDVSAPASVQLRADNQKLSAENQEMADRLAEMEKLLLAAGGKLPEKKVAVAAEASLE